MKSAIQLSIAITVFLGVWLGSVYLIAEGYGWYVLAFFIGLCVVLFGGLKLDLGAGKKKPAVVEAQQSNTEDPHKKKPKKNWPLLAMIVALAFVLAALAIPAASDGLAGRALQVYQILLSAFSLIACFLLYRAGKAGSFPPVLSLMPLLMLLFMVHAVKYVSELEEFLDSKQTILAPVTDLSTGIVFSIDALLGAPEGADLQLTAEEREDAYNKQVEQWLDF